MQSRRTPTTRRIGTEATTDPGENAEIAVTTVCGSRACCLALRAKRLCRRLPEPPVRLIVPFPPGGSNDVVGRLVAQQLSNQLGQQVFVDNRGGAGGVIGTEACATAAPDGYTLCIISIAHAVNPALHKLNYDPIKSFTPISIFATGPNVLAINPTLPVNSVKELVALAKQKPGELNYASAGVGSFQHLGGELFKLTAGRQHRARAVQRWRAGHAGRDQRACEDHVLIADPDHAVYQIRSAEGAGHRAARNAPRFCPMCRRSPRQACPAMSPTIGGGSPRLPGFPPIARKAVQGEPGLVESSRIAGSNSSARARQRSP